MNIMGDEMRNEQRSISGIDKVLDYIQHNIENQKDDDGVMDLIDVHTLLTSIKVSHLESKKGDNTTSEDLYILSYMVINSFNATFGGWESHTQVTDNSVLLYNDILYMDINRDNGYTECYVSFQFNTKPIIVAEVINTLKDIFGMGLRVNDESFIIDEATGGYLWGNERINQYLRNINGNKIKPILFFDDDEVGNC